MKTSTNRTIQVFSGFKLNPVLSKWLLILIIQLGATFSVKSQQFWRTDGTASTWVAGTNWGATALPTGGSAWASGAANFTANSTITFATATVGNVVVGNGLTVVVTAAGTASGVVVRTYDIGTGSTLTWTGQALPTSSGFGVIKNGSGIWDMGAQANAFNATNGGFRINAGTVIVSGNNNFGGAPSVLSLFGGTIQSSGTRTYTNSITVGGNFALSGTGTATHSGAVALGAATRTITNSTASGSRVFSGVISGAAGSGITYDGSGAGVIRVSNAANTYTGTTSVTGAEVEFFSGDGAFGAVPGSVTANSIIIDGGRLTINTGATTTLSSNRGIQIGATAGTGISVKTGATILVYNGVIADKPATTGSWAKQGGNVLQIGGASTYTGNTSINNGTLQLTTGNNRLPTTTVLGLGEAANNNLGIFDLNARNQQVAGINSAIGTNATASKNTITSVVAATLTLGGTGTYSYGDATSANSGIISGAISLSKSGSGTQTLGDANTYTGTTTVSAGSLIIASTGSLATTGATNVTGGSLVVNGTTSSGSTITVSSGATLGGNGTAAGTVSNSGIISPGSAASTIGNLNTGAATFAANSTYKFEFSALTGTPGTNWDLLTSSSAIDVTASPITIDVTVVGSPGFNQLAP